MSWSLKNVYLAPADEQNIYIFSNLDPSFFLEKYDELYESIAFDQKLRYFTNQNEQQVGRHEINFEYFQI